MLIFFYSKELIYVSKFVLFCNLSYSLLKSATHVDKKLHPLYPQISILVMWLSFVLIVSPFQVFSFLLSQALSPNSLPLFGRRAERNAERERQSVLPVLANATPLAKSLDKILLYCLLKTIVNTRMYERWTDWMFL